MTETAAPQITATSSNGGSRFGRLVEEYRQDHRNPVNHFLHVGVGWPIMAAAVILVPFRPLWSLALFVLSYAIMWAGHFVFERNLPTIFRHPSTPFVIAWAVVRGFWASLTRSEAQTPSSSTPLRDSST
jgi:hypothetical protein